MNEQQARGEVREGHRTTRLRHPCLVPPTLPLRVPYAGLPEGAHSTMSPTCPHSR